MSTSPPAITLAANCGISVMSKTTVAVLAKTVAEKRAEYLRMYEPSDNCVFVVARLALQLRSERPRFGADEVASDATAIVVLANSPDITKLQLTQLSYLARKYGGTVTATKGKRLALQFSGVGYRDAKGCSHLKIA